jgi:hypothetical protein
MGTTYKAHFQAKTFQINSKSPYYPIKRYNTMKICCKRDFLTLISLINSHICQTTPWGSWKLAQKMSSCTKSLEVFKVEIYFIVNLGA